MTMLRPAEFSIGSLKSATTMSLFLRRTEHDNAALVIPLGGRLIAVSLGIDQDSSFRYFECSNNDDWAGLLIPDVSIEVDATKLFDPNINGLRLGTLVRHSQMISIVARPLDGFGSYQMVHLQTNLQSAAATLSAGFYKWTVGLGTGQHRRILFNADRSCEAK